MTSHPAPLPAPGFGPGFSARKIVANGITLDAVEGGAGPLVVLMAGWPQSLLAWRKVLPTLARDFRVLAFDPPNLGTSEASRTGGDTGAMAGYVDGLLDAIGADKVLLVGHDIGAWIGYAYAAHHPERVTRLALMDAAIPGLTPREAYGFNPVTAHKVWHFPFNFVPGLAERLVVGRERDLLAFLFETKPVNVAATFEPEVIEAYMAAYSAPGRWIAGLEYYRAIFESAAQNEETGRTPLPMPVLAIGGDYGIGGAMVKALEPATTTLSSVVIPQCGHYVPEERPAELLAALVPFLKGE
ncbi:alpha/beta hydrolase [Aquabacter sp. L1I39]|uniref:alpha/beta fold hydrolase n=1 Tax=Aquabacter sp. L1I39 TaxID=2820278 RepID=UPI001AD9C976|nr:alpha/beta hydrolase [Aquabacter sp. L1I39]QTL02097.1 alpha/beta hydrolase [Aquabacter sp. L1I39]